MKQGLIFLTFGILTALNATLGAQTDIQPPPTVPRGFYPSDGTPGSGGPGWGRRFGGPFAAGARPIDTGYIILNGQYLAPPYQFTYDDTGRLLINGQPGPVEFRAGQFQGGVSERPRSFWQQGGASFRSLFRITRHLNSGGLIIAQDYAPLVYIAPYDAASVLDLLRQTDQSPETRLQALVDKQLPGTSTELWAFLIQTFQPTDELNARIDDQLAFMAKLQAEDPDSVVASKDDVHNMTWLGFALTVLAFGLLLSHRPPPMRKWHGINPSPLACRQVVTLIALIVALNAYDLYCTLYAHKYWGLWEMNPLASAFIANTPAAVLYKSSLILTTAFILTRFRRYRIAQIGVWWAGIFYTVLVFRWSTSTSLFL